MAAIFAFEVDEQGANDGSPRPGPPPLGLAEMEWPALGGKTSPALRPNSGLRGLLQPANVSALAANGSLYSWPAVPTRTGSNSGTAKGGLAHLLANSQPSTRAPSDAGDVVAERAADTYTVSTKKKSKGKKKGRRAIGGAVVSTAHLERPDYLSPRVLKPSVSTSSLRDDAAQPVNKGESDRDYLWAQVKQRSVSSSSRTTSPAGSALSSLLSQAHPGDIAAVEGSDTSASSENGEDPLVTYEVAMDEDYVSKDVDSRPSSRTASPSRGIKITADDFEPLKCLGKGAYGTVLLVRHKATGRLFAQKQLKKATLVVHKKVIEQTKTERSILESIRHPFVVKLYYAFQDHEKLYLILEYAQGGELFHHLAETRMFCEDTVAFYIAELVLALSHLHQNAGVVYRDLKPENCLLDADGHLLLTDFGLSKVSSEGSRCSSLLGTPGYMAPEVLNGDGSEYGAEVDWWGVGILAFELLTGNLPFEGNSPEKVKQKIQKRKLQLPSYLSADAKDFIIRLLRKEPRRRLGYNLSKDLSTIKRHRFFRKIDWVRLEARDISPPIRPLVTDPLLAENFSNEFTELPLSPTVGNGFPISFHGRRHIPIDNTHMYGEEGNPFSGFSFVAPSLLEPST